VQLLSGDRAGYRRTCKFMLAGGREGKLRAYLVARAWTLAPGAVEELGMVVRVSADELSSSPNAFWSLTERGALRCRTNRVKAAIPLFEQSLRVERRLGAQVLNCFWLALAYHKLGKTAEARSWLSKASTWLDGLGKELPANADAYLLHRHNWLEAHVLQREAKALLR
jgi:hypothetical protein